MPEHPACEPRETTLEGASPYLGVGRASGAAAAHVGPVSAAVPAAQLHHGRHFERRQAAATDTGLQRRRQSEGPLLAVTLGLVH